jgi:hypothetical protein
MDVLKTKGAHDPDERVEEEEVTTPGPEWWDDPKKVCALLDLLFLGEEERHKLPS